MKRDELEAMIRNAPREEIDAYFDAAIERKQELYPDWGILYMAIPKNDPAERKKTIQGIIRPFGAPTPGGGMGISGQMCVCGVHLTAVCVRRFSLFHENHDKFL